MAGILTVVGTPIGNLNDMSPRALETLKTVDFIVEGLDRSKAVMIMSEKAEEVSQALMEEFETGTTLWHGRGGYSNNEKTVVYFVVNRFQIARMRNLVHALDPKAFMTITDVADVFKAND